MNPYYLGLAMNLAVKKVVVLGFRQTKEQIEALASLRTPGLPFTIIEMHHDTEATKKQIKEWLILRGMPEDHADYMVKTVARSGLEAMGLL